MRRKMSKIMAFMLAFAMLAGILPTGTPQAAAAEPMEMAGVKEVYDFLAIDKEKYPADMGTTYDFNVIGKNNYDFSSAQNWAFADITEEVGLRVQGTYALTFGSLSGTSDWFALKIKVPAAGRYMLQMSHIKVPTGLKADVYILPGNTEDIAAALESAASVGELDTYAEIETVVSSPEDIGYADFATSGDYIFVIKAQDATSGGKYILPRNLILNGIEIKKIEPMEMADAKAEYEFMAVNTNSTWEGKGSYGTEYFLDDMPDDGAVGGNWRFFGKKGKDEKFNIKIDPTWYTSINNIWYENDWIALELDVPAAGRYKLQMAYNVGPNGVAVDVFALQGADFLLSSINDICDELEPVCTIDTYTATGDNVGNYRVDAANLENLGYVDFAQGGKNVLVLRRDGQYANSSSFAFGKIILNGFEKDKPMEWANAERAYDFLDCASASGDWTYPAYPDNMSVIGMPYGGSINEYWAYAGHSYTNDRADGINLQKTWYLQFIMPYANDWGAIKIKVPATGRYKASYTRSLVPTGVDAEVYILPGSKIKAIADNLNEKYFVGKVECHSETTDEKNNDIMELGEFNASEQEMIVVFRNPKTENTYLLLRSLVIDGNYGDTGVIAKNTAYIREVVADGKTSYAIEFLGAINRIDGYSEVGFEVSVNGGEAIKYGGQNVYTALAMTDTDITPGQFGKDASYIIWETVAGFAAGDNVVFRAYAKDADGNYTYGYQYVITATK